MTPDGVEVAGRAHRRVQHHPRDPLGVAQAETLHEVRAVRRAVGDDAVDALGVEHRGQVADGRLDGQRRRRQVGVARAPGQPDPAVLHHQHVHALGGGQRAQHHVGQHRRQSRATGHDQHRRPAPWSGADVAQLERAGPVGQRPRDRCAPPGSARRSLGCARQLVHPCRLNGRRICPVPSCLSERRPVPAPLHQHGSRDRQPEHLPAEQLPRAPAGRAAHPRS